MMFFSTPELVLCLCHVLDDANLLVLSQVSRRLNTLALHTFFVRHGMTLSDIGSGIFSLSSISLHAFRIALFIPPLTKLSCTFDAATAQSDISSLQDVLSKFPPIPELNITTSAVTYDLQSLTGAFSRLLFTLGPYSNFLVLSGGFFSVSKHRRVLHTKHLRFPLTIRNVWCCLALTPFMCSFCLAQRLMGAVAFVSSAFSDPFARAFQDERIYNDLDVLRPTPCAVRIKSPILSHPSFAKWTMVTFDESIMTTLLIEHIPFLDDEKWCSIFSSLFLPCLEHLTIRQGPHISLSTLTAFINRHTTIQSLILHHHSIPYSSYPSPNTTLSLSPNCLDQLKFVCASSRLIHLLLRSIPIPNLHDINIGPEIQMDYRKFYGRGMNADVRAKVETPFDFVALDRALATIKDCGHSVTKLAVTLPGGSKAKKWLEDHRLDLSLSSAGTLFPHVRQIGIATERGIPLAKSVILPLADWIVRMFVTSNLRKLCLMHWVIVDLSARVVFEKRVREVTGDAVEFSIGPIE